MNESDLRHGRSPLRTLVLGALVAIVAACGETAVTSPPPASPSASAVPSTSAEPATSSPAAAADCASTDLEVSGGPWGGAAGSRGTDVLVANGGGVACRLPAGPLVAIVDSTGAVLLQSQPTPVGPGPTLDPGGTIAFSILIGNWCDAATSLPLGFQLALAAGVIEIDGVSMATGDDLPPCNGPGQPATLTTTGWTSG
jgi:hypothetical protein